MWKKTAEISLRAALVATVALYDVAPAAASLVARPASPVRPSEIADPMNLPELAPILAALGAGPQRQSVDHPGGKSQTQTDSRGTERDFREIPLSRPRTQAIIADLEEIKRECSTFDQVYRIDCLRQGIDMIVAKLPDNSEYREAKRILRRTSNRLGRIVATYQDRSMPALEIPANANPRFKKKRKLTAVRQDVMPEAMAKAQQAVEEAATALLRSGENSQRRYAHYQEISVAVDSTKVLLRSS
jgi:hypothetical protein